MDAYQKLKEFNKKEKPGLYISSLFMVNRGIPRFEEHFGQLDYDWLLKVTKKFKHTKTEPLVIRHVDGNNLSTNKLYRKRDFYMMMLELDGNIPAMRRAISTRARFYYNSLDGKEARFWFLRGKISLKTILYYLTSFSKVLMKLINNKFRVVG